MNTLLMAPNMERNHDKRFRLSWSKKTVPLKSSALFSKTKHSQEWHQIIEATAGVLHPSDPNFPYTSLHSHTDSYLEKKGKLSQTDIDIRLAILVEGHESKDIAIAAVAHVMTAKAIRSLLSAELNVAHGSYWGLETWLQCLVAANNGNPASVTDLEAYWAKIMLPYASHGASAARLYLQGVCAAMRQSNVTNLDILPDFMILLRRAFTDFATQLEGYRLRCDWSAAHAATSWLNGLNVAERPGQPERTTSPERLFDHFFPAWRIWALWKPDTDRLARLAMFDNTRLASITDVLSLEGPDIIIGMHSTLKEGIIARYEAGKPWLQYRGLVIDVPQRTKKSLQAILERVLAGTETILKCLVDRPSLLDLFTHLVVAQPITNEGLDLFEATSGIRDPHDGSIDISVRNVYAYREHLDGEQLLSLQQLIRTLDGSSAKELRSVMIQPWLIRGIEKCIQSCQIAIKEHIDDRLDWMPLALELHAFCAEVRESPHIFPLLGSAMAAQLESWISTEQMDAMKDILETSHKQESSICTTNLDEGDTTIEIYALGSTPPHTHLEKLIAEFYTHRCLKLGKIDPDTQGAMNHLLGIWKSTAGPVIDNDRRLLAITVSRLLDNNVRLRNECLGEVATENRLLRPPDFIHDLLGIMQQYEAKPAAATVSMARLLVERQAWTKCWKDVLFIWLACGDKAKASGGVGFLEYTLQTMRAAEWLAFMRVLETLFSNKSESTGSTVPEILQPGLRAWKSRVSNHLTTLTRLEDQFSDGGVDERVRYILGCGEEASRDLFISILECLDESQGQSIESVTLLAVKKLSADSKNERQVEDCIRCVKGATIKEEELYKQVWSICCGNSWTPEHISFSQKAGETAKTTKSATIREQDLPHTVRDVMIAGYLADTDIKLATRFAIMSIAVLFDINIHKTVIPVEKIKQAAAFWSKREDEILQEAARLDGLIKKLTQIDPQGTKLLLEEYNIPNFNPLDNELSSLPPDILDVVEKLSDNKVEISFPLTSLSKAHRQAMGIPKAATTVMISLETDYYGNDEPQHCTTRFDCFVSKVDYERQPAPNLFLWQILRVLRAQLDAGPNPATIAGLHGAVTARIQGMRYTCAVCNRPRTPNVTKLLRPGPCDLQSCQDVWDSLPIDLRIPEIRYDRFAVDILLAGLYEAANTSRPELVPGTKLEWFNIQSVANTLPSFSVLSDAMNLAAILPAYHINADRLLTQACGIFPGILASAEGVCKIPNLPVGTHQFILSSEDPARETAFAARLSKAGMKTRILFHGTSMDRLPGILSRGLRICSGTSLQRVGAAHGKGIYLAEGISTAFSYAPTYLSWHNSGLANMRLVLGCEVAGMGQPIAKSGVHVITDEQSVMVRYVFLFRNDATVPFARNIVPAMQSGIRALSDGTI